MVRVQNQEIKPTKKQRQYRHGRWTYRKIINGVQTVRPTSLGDLTLQDGNLSQAVSDFMCADEANSAFMQMLFIAYAQQWETEAFWNRLGITLAIFAGLLFAVATLAT